MNASVVTIFVSPHFDDIAFSCGGTLLKRANAGNPIILCTVFTRDTRPMSTFALSCQTSKGFGIDVEYLALRSGEDKAYCEKAGISSRLELGWCEAPYRGYDSLTELFGPPKPSDVSLLGAVMRQLHQLITSQGSNVEVFAPLAVGRHVDHKQVRTAVEMLVELKLSGVDFFFYEDLPYCIRNPNFWEELGPTLMPHVEDISTFIDKKNELLLAYSSQIQNQYGSNETAIAKTKEYAEQVARRAHIPGFAEGFFIATPYST